MGPKSRRISCILLGLAAVIILVVMPCLNAFVPPHVMGADGVPVLNANGEKIDHPWHVSSPTITKWGKYLCFATLAISMDLLWGYTGLLSLGQALFFALGGYMMGMYLMLNIGVVSESGRPMAAFLKDMLGWKELPWFWVPFSSFAFAALMVVVVPGIVATIFGYLAFRSRIKGVYFSIITQALTYAAGILFFMNSLLMGGNNGFTNFKFMLGADVRLASTGRWLLVSSGILLIVVFFVCRWLTRTKFGLVQRAIRDSETRVLFSGYAAANFKLFTFVLCGIIAALAGALYVPQAGILNPNEMDTSKSLEIVVWVALGGRGTLLGPVIGAIVVNAVKSWATGIEELVEYWPIMLGGMFVLVVLFMPKGLVGLPEQFRGWFARGRKNPTAEEASGSEKMEGEPLAKPAP
jgi:urea transport system permease protein